MNKLLCCIISITLSINTYASQIFTCPEKITCTRDADKSSCSWPGKGKDNWKSDFYEDGKIGIGEYKFQRAAGPFETPYKDAQSYCLYVNNNYKFKKFIQLYNDPYKIFEVFYDENTNWQISGYGGLCFSDDYSKCPFIKYQ